MSSATSAGAVPEVRRDRPGASGKNLEISPGDDPTAKALGCKVPVLRIPGRIRNAPGSDHGGDGLRAEIPHGEAKLAMRERAKRSAGSSACVTFTRGSSAPYGPGDHPWTLVESCLDAFLNNREMSLGACTQNWNFLYIDDLARGMAALCEAEETTFKGISNPVFNFFEARRQRY